MTWQTIGFTRETSELVTVAYKGAATRLVFGWLVQEWTGQWPAQMQGGPTRRVVAGVLVPEVGEIRPVDEQDFLHVVDLRTR
jgi:hypothetical protein